MSGIINDTPAPSDDTAAPAEKTGAQLSNPLLQQAEQQLETKLTPENAADVDKIIVAGLHIALAKGPDGFMGRLRNVPDPISACAQGAVSLVLILRKQSRGVMPMKAAVPAAMSLMLRGLDFVDRSKIVPIGEPELVRATHIFTDFLFAKLGVSKQALAGLAGKVHGFTQSPEAMQAINMKAGLLRHPMAATPTPLPGGMINGAGADTP